ncbi:MAG TPA: vWA domain-containing protein [Acidimicrobiia bacterium]|jgi:Ca-activated chloride channel family protein
MMPVRKLRFFAMITAFALVAAACGEPEPLTIEEAQVQLQELVDDVGWIDDPVTRRANLAPAGAADLAQTLPDIDQFPIEVRGNADVVVEVFVSTEKSGDGTDGWMIEVAEDFNDGRVTLSDGRTAAVSIREIASGTGYQYIAAGRDIPGGFSPSNRLWIQMASVHEPMTSVTEQLVPNVAGIVMKTETAEQLRAEYDDLDAASLIEAVISGDVVMGYTDPFASSTGLNFLLTVLDEFADGDQSRLTAPDVASVLEQFQQQVPFVALTTLQMRESVENENGSLDAFVMEWQTYVKTESLRSGFEFIPFGVRHDNPLYAVGDVSPGELETLQAFADFASRDRYRNLAEDYGFDPPDYTSDVEIPPGQTLIAAQNLWKEKKDGGRPVAAVFVADVSGSMAGSRLVSLQRALRTARSFISTDASVGMVEFSDQTVLRLPIEGFDLNQQARFIAAVEDMDAAGGTAMYDGITLGLSMLLNHKATNPSAKLLLIVLTDGETNEGYTLNDVQQVIGGLRIPVYSVGFEANLDELGRLSSLVEAATINASEEDVEFKISALFNAGT